MILFSCPGCGNNLKVPEDSSGIMVSCPGCKQPVKVPVAASDQVRSAKDPSLLPPEKSVHGFTLQCDQDPGNDHSLQTPGTPVRGFTLASDSLVENQADPPGPEPGNPWDQEVLDFLAPAQEPGELGRLGRYRVLKVLGVGGMGVVFQAEDSQLRRQVALKAMLPALAASPASRRRFQREAQAIAGLEHDHIISIFDIGEEKRIPFLAMPLLQGETLEDRLQRPPRLPPAEAIRLAREIALGLAAAHQRGLMHRDIKPANIWLEGPGARVKILDFGLARAVEEEAHLTRTGSLLGSPAYMAPEQAAGAPVDQRGDLFSLGCILYQLGTGQQPFTGNTPVSLVMAVATQEPRPVEEVNTALPAGLGVLVRRLMAKRPEDRPGSAQEVAETLAALESSLGSSLTFDLPPLAQPPTLPRAGEPLAARPPRNPLGWILLGAGTMLGGLVVLGIIWRVGGTAAEKSSPGNKESTKGAPEENVPREPVVEKTIINTIGMKLVLIPAGKFTMGSPESEEDRGKDEFQHKVEITRPFYLGIYTVTQAQFRKFKKDHISYFSAEGSGKAKVEGLETDDFPVERVTWEEARDFCKWLTEQEKKKGFERVYRLPTEAEWEYACRGGAASYHPFHFGDSISSREANFDSNYPYGGAEKVEPLNRTTKVGSYKPNAFGLYDMHGNVYQWCADWYDADYYQNSPLRDPENTKEASNRVLRGGCWIRLGWDCRSAIRNWPRPDYRISLCGFRVAAVQSGR